MKLRKLTAVSAGAMLALSTFAAPHLAQAQDNSVAGDEYISFESSQGTEINPGETITFEADYLADDVGIWNAYPDETDHIFNWDIDFDRWVGTVTVTAPSEPEVQEEEHTNVVDYGEHDIHIRTSEWTSYMLTLDFQPEDVDEPEDPEDPSSVADVREQLRNLSSNLSSF